MPVRIRCEGLHVLQSADYHDRDAMPPTDPSASLVRLLTTIGAGTREAMWAAQLIERKAAVARWRSGQTSKAESRPLQCGKGRPT
jgi:hypothetical protein